MINNVIQVNDIEQATNTRVKVLEEKAVTSPDAAGKIQDNSVAIFNPEVNVDAAAKPKKEIKVEQIVTARKAQGIQFSDVPAASATSGDKTKDAKPAISEPSPTDTSAVETPAVKYKKDKATVVPPADTGNATTDVSVEKGKKKKAVTEPVVPHDTQQGTEPQ